MCHVRCNTVTPTSRNAALNLGEPILSSKLPLSDHALRCSTPGLRPPIHPKRVDLGLNLRREPTVYTPSQNGHRLTALHVIIVGSTISLLTAPADIYHDTNTASG